MSGRRPGGREEWRCGCCEKGQEVAGGLGERVRWRQTEADDVVS